MNIKITKVHADAQIPKKSTLGSNGYDLSSVSKKWISKDIVEYDTGVAIQLPKNFGGFILARSSISKKPMMLVNGIGLIDSDFRGTLKIRFKVFKKQNLYKIGERIAQLVIIKTEAVDFEEVVALSTTKRGVGGFGSSGL